MILQSMFRVPIRSFLKAKVSATNIVRTRKTFYANAFGKYLLWTNTAGSGVLMLLGDLAQQKIEIYQKKLDNYDMGRSTRMFLVGLSQGPIQHYFYLRLHKYFPVRNVNNITKKIFADQLIMSPVGILSFFYLMGLMEGKAISGCNEEIKEKYFKVYLMDWMVWPPTQFINFYFLPVKYQMMYVNIVTMAYNVFLSFIKHTNFNENNSPIKDPQKN